MQSISGKVLAVSLCLTLAAISLATPSGEITPPSTGIPLTYFGLHMHWADISTPWPPVPFGSWRLWDSHTTWAQLEPRKGQWEWKALDKDVSLAEEHGVEIVLTLGRTPQWASARPQETGRHADIPAGGLAEPRNLDDWRDYVRTVATRYKGRIHQYEVWNEPNLPGFYSGTPEAMRDLAREAYTTLKQVDSENIVVSPSAVGPTGLPWMEEYLRLGGGRYADVIGWHFYVAKRPPEAILDFLPRLGSVLNAGGVGDKPLWNTEAGWTIPANVDPSDGPAYVARAYVLNWALGIARFYWYAWDDQHLSVRLTESDRATPSAAGRAYGQVAKWLVGARMDSLREEHGSFICQLSRDGRKSWVVWNPEGRGKLDIPKSWGVTTVQKILGERNSFPGGGLEIDSSPMLLETADR
jgi:hypothetical protein